MKKQVIIISTIAVILATLLIVSLVLKPSYGDDLVNNAMREFESYTNADGTPTGLYDGPQYYTQDGGLVDNPEYTIVGEKPTEVE